MSVYIWAATKDDYSAMRGPCPEGFHVPSEDERTALCGILASTFSMASSATTMGTYLKMPSAGLRNRSSSGLSGEGSNGYYWSSTGYSTGRTYYLYITSSSLNPQELGYRASGFTVRCFKDAPVIPDSNWTTLYQGTWSAWVFRNSSLWLISVSWNWTTWYTIQDKNLWATTVFNQWDTLSDANCGYFYQWGNNYWFAHSWTITTSNTQVDASNYWPWNYYNSSTFITRSSSPYDWSSVQNDNLWWWVTWVQQIPKELKSAYIGDYECIEYKMNADSNGNLYVPVSWYNRSNSVSYINCSYDWYIGVDWWTPTNYTWTGSKWWSITLSWYTAWSSHIIKITPKTMAYWWALAYWWYNTAGAPNVTEVYYDWGYKWYGYTKTNTSICYKYRQFYWCTALTKAPDEMLPTTVTTIWNHYRDEQYRWCTALVNAPAEVLPNTVTSVWDYFRYNQYYWCTALQVAATEVFVNSLTTIWTYFRSWQYYWCTSLIVPSIEVMSNNLKTVWTYFRWWQYYNCGILAAAVPEVLPSTVTTIWNYFRLYQYRWCSSILAATNEVLPNWVTTIWTNFRNWQYYDCTSLETAAAEVIPNTVTSIWEKFRYTQYEWCSSLIAAATEVFPNTITTIWRDFRYSQYEWCSSLVTPSIEVLPSSVTSVWYQFRANQYRECTSLTTTPIEVFPSTITSAWANFRNWQYTSCTALTTVSWILNSDTCTFASGDFRWQQFFSCTSNKVVTVLSDIWPATPNANSLQNSYVTTVRVPSAYLNNFKNATTYPWSAIDDSKFIWY